MRDFAWARAGTVADAVDALAGPDTMAVAGGTELLNWMRLGIAAPGRVVDLGGLDGLAGIRRDGDKLVIGARATLNELGEHPLVAEHAGALASACLQAASAQIRNRATLGGNVLQRTRCPYFRAEAPVPWPCSKRESGSGCAARVGDHARHAAVFGATEDCVAVQPSDPAVALAALDAVADIVGPDGARTIPMRAFHLTQAEAAALGDPQREHRLEAAEIITGYRIPVHGDRSAYVKIRERASYEYAIVSAAAGVRLDGDRISSARVALGSVAQRPWRLDVAETGLAGLPLTREALLPVVGAAMADAVPLEQNAFTVPMARNAAVRALLLAGGAA